MQIGPQIAEESDRRPGLDITVQIALELVWYVVDVWVRDLRRTGVDLGDHVHFEVGRERIGQFHAAWEGAEDQVAQLNAVGGYDVAELVVAVAEELGKVVEQDEEEAESASVQQHD